MPLAAYSLQIVIKDLVVSHSKTGAAASLVGVLGQRMTVDSTSVKARSSASL